MAAPTDPTSPPALPPLHKPVTVDLPRGATVESYYECRNMRIYPVAEHEIDAFTVMNTLNTVLLTVGVGLISLAVGIWVTAMFADKITPEAEVLSRFGAWILVGLGVLCIILMRLVSSKRKSMWNRIVKESGEKHLNLL